MANMDYENTRDEAEEMLADEEYPERYTDAIPWWQRM